MLRPALVATALLAGATALPSSAAPAPGLPFDLTAARTVTCVTPANLVLTTLGGCLGDTASSYVGETWPAAGPLEVSGTTFTWPAWGSGVKDTVVSTGQVIPAPPKATGFKSVALLAVVKGPKVKVPITITYTDGTKATEQVELMDWKTKNGEGSALPKVRTQYYSQPFSETFFGVEGAIGLNLVPVDPKKTVKSITLPPESGPDMLLYAASMSTLKELPKPGPKFTP